MYATGKDWKSWMQVYRYGTLAFLPSGDLRHSVDRLRAEHDPLSAQTSMAHMTLTQPFARPPSDLDTQAVSEIIKSSSVFDIVVGPVITSPNKKLIWLDISAKEKILSLRDRLHKSGLFRIDMPFTNGFIPHMTISELPRDPEEVLKINEELNAIIKPWTSSFATVSWIVPNDEFTFREHRSFELNSNLKN